MPIFHFDIADGVRLEDPVGLDWARRVCIRATRWLAMTTLSRDGAFKPGAFTRVNGWKRRWRWA